MDAKLIELEQAPVGRLLLRYSMPAIVGMVAMSAYNIIDSIYVGKWLDAYAIAAMALVFPMMNLMVAVGTLVGLGSAATASICLGQKDYRRAEAVLGHCIVMGLFFAFLVGWLPLPWLEEVLRFFGADGELMQPAYDFMLVLGLSFPLNSAFMNLNHLMRASGYPKKAMFSLLLSMVVNVAVAPVYIYVLDWGMCGAALATVTAQAIGLIWVLAHYACRRSVLHFCRGIFRPQWVLVRRICTIGLPPCLLNIVGCVVVVAFNMLLRRYDGPMGIGAYGLANRVLFFFVMFVLGITQGVQPIAGYNLGMGLFPRVKRVLYWALAASFVVTTLGFVLVQSFPDEIAAVFAMNSADANAPLLKSLAARGLRLMAICFPLVGPLVVVANFFQAIGCPLLSISLNLTRQLFFLLPCLLCLPPCMGEAGIWLSQSVADGLSAMLSVVVLYLFLTRVFTKKTLA